MGWAGPGVNREHPLLLPVAEPNELLIDAVFASPFVMATERRLSADGPVFPTGFRLVYRRP